MCQELAHSMVVYWWIKQKSLPSQSLCSRIFLPHCSGKTWLLEAVRAWGGPSLNSSPASGGRNAKCHSLPFGHCGTWGDSHADSQALGDTNTEWFLVAAESVSHWVPARPRWLPFGHALDERGYTKLPGALCVCVCVCRVRRAACAACQLGSHAVIRNCGPRGEQMVARSARSLWGLAEAARGRCSWKERQDPAFTNWAANPNSKPREAQ